MAMLTVYFLLLLCTMYTGTRGACPDSSYCPAGSDCSRNSSLCEAGVCDFNAVPTCEKGVSVAFSSNSYSFVESIGKGRLVLTLDGPIECCSISVAVKFESGSAKGGEDYTTTKDSYVVVKFAAGQTIVPFYVDIVDDEYMEEDETFTVSIFDLSVPWGVALGGDNSAVINIIDDDGTTLSFRHSTFRVKENAGPARVELVLTVPANFNISVTITSQNNNLSVSCDRFSAETYSVTFVNGTTSEILLIEITDDGIYEGDESFTLQIQDSFQDLVTLGSISTTTVVVEEDEAEITANFEHKMYTVQEHDGSVAPKIRLSRPSPCCFILHAQLMDITAKGGTVDFGYQPPKIYNYTFNVGSTCASPDANISITDDMVKENEETFKISIIDYSLPFGVVSGGPATIAINDNDNCVSFQYPEETVSEDETQIYLRACLDKPATNNLIIPVFSESNTAHEGDDYAPGPYNVSFRKGQTCRYFAISIIDNDVYEGNKNFQISFQRANLPNGVVPCTPSAVEITILEDELQCCFEKLSYEVIEGDRLDSNINCNRQLPYSLTITLKYMDGSAKLNSDYYNYQRSARLSTGSNETSFYVRTREDTIQEPIEECFEIELDYNGKPNNTNCNVAIVCILDDDDFMLAFQYSQYSRSESSSFQIRLVLNKVPTSTFSVIVYEEDDTAEGGHDYEVQRYRNIRFINGGSKYHELTIKPINDNETECSEAYFLRIETLALPPRIISLEPRTKITLTDDDDDRATVTRVEDKLLFSRAISCDLEIKVDYYTGTSRVSTYFLPAGAKEVTLDVSRTIQRITIYICDCLSTSKFIVRASRVYVRKALK